MNNFTMLLSRLDKVRKAPLRNDLVAAHRAVCPACGTKNWTKLSVGLTQDGWILINCFAGCTAADIAASIGMTVADLMPSRSGETQAHNGLARGLSDWVSAAALADAVAWAAGIVANDPSESNLATLVVASNQFQLAARRAMRGV